MVLQQWSRFPFTLVKSLACIILCLFLVNCSANQDVNRIELTLWQGVNPPPNRQVLQQLVDRFNQEHPQIHVNSLYVGQPDQQLPKILAAVVGNSPPDLLWYNPTVTGQLVNLGALRSLDDWWATTPRRTEITPSLAETMTYDDHIWSVPFAANNLGIFYRPSLFEAAGVTQLPNTWPDLQATAQALTTTEHQRTNRHGILLALGQGDFAVFTWLPFLWTAGGNLGATAATAHLDTPAAIAAMEFWQNLISTGVAIRSLPERGYELDNFINSRVAMQITGPWTLAQLNQSGIDFGVMPIPQDPAQGDRAAATALGGENLFIFKSTPEKETAALLFADYVLSETFQTDWALGTGYLPANIHSLENPRYQAFLTENPVIQVFLDQMPTARSRPLFPGYARFSENLGRALESVLMEQNTPLEALKIAEKHWQLMRPRQ
ncbi:ABC transporter substrate-binding protein [Candidatus Synechococcus calcipolaris G9]|uniref:ABC transporter substrate-binding protein n=1 Tax=Candidatus Synechococcus calcipolaris G9 TaxID=1497997 RepID=A0ABT6F387_9SYNE|nr:ABC transporter substrate-binding protein [Candidatus Synechococcus calcipolaris]MDG2992297.1 ABC transporter substrate-binding protein [Candidatus Synechococcus calcipolaris G9]